MPVAGQTRQAIRAIIGRNLAGARFILGTTTSTSCDTTSVIDNIRLATYNNDELIGYWIRFTSGCNDGEVREVTDSVTSTGDLVTLAFSNNVPSSAGFEAWPPEFHPENADRAINDVIISTYGKGYAPIESEDLHSGGKILRYTLPTTFSYLNKVLMRTSVKSESLLSMEAVMDEATDSDITQTVDTENHRTGSGCLKCVIVSGASANDFISDSIASTDISWATHIEMWVKSNVTVAAGAIHVRIDDTASLASPLETLAIPALTADAWTFIRVALAVPEDLTAIISVGIRFTTDTGAQVVYFDDLRAVDERTARWEPFHWDAWAVDKANREFYFKVTACDVGYGLMRLVGGQEPQTLCSETAVLTIDDDYIIKQATAQMFAQTHMSKYEKSVEQWESRAALAYRGVRRPARGSRFLQ